MKSLFTILFLVFASIAPAALTTRWVTDAGAGAADGTSEAAAMSFTTFVDYMSTGGSFTAAAGDVFQLVGNITDRTTTADTFVNGGTSTSPVVIRGVVTGGATAYGGRNSVGALITTNFPTIPYTSGGIALTGNWIVMENIKVTASATATGAIVVSTGANCVIKSCYSSAGATGTNGRAISTAVICAIIDCDCVVTNNGSAGGAAINLNNATGTKVFGCRVTGTAIGINSSAVAGVIIGNTVYNCGTIGISISAYTSYHTILSNTVTGCTGDGIDIITATSAQHLIGNNCITDNGGYGIDFNSSAVGATTFNNRYRDNTSGATNLGTDMLAATNWAAVTTDTGGASTDYTNVGGNDYSLIAGSPATSAGIPASASIGALQRLQTGAGGETSTTFVGN